MKCGECQVATTNPKDKTDCYFCPFDKVNAFHSLHDCSHLSELVEKMAELLKEQKSRINFLEHQREKGHWIFGETSGHQWMKCSQCCVSQDGQTLCFTFCPNCGAEMTDGSD